MWHAHILKLQVDILVRELHVEFAPMDLDLDETSRGIDTAVLHTASIRIIWAEWFGLRSHFWKKCPSLPLGAWNKWEKQNQWQWQCPCQFWLVLYSTFFNMAQPHLDQPHLACSESGLWFCCRSGDRCCVSCGFDFSFSFGFAYCFYCNLTSRIFEVAIGREDPMVGRPWPILHSSHHHTRTICKSHS